MASSPTSSLKGNVSNCEAVVVVPTFNETQNLERLVEEILTVSSIWAAGVLVVDDASADGTGILADALTARHPGRVACLHRPGKLGLGTAYLEGFGVALEAGAELVLEMDADFSHPPRYLPALLEAASSADVVLGSRYVKGGRIVNWDRKRHLLSRFGSSYARCILGVPIRDLTGGFKCYRAGVLRSIDLPSIRSRGYAFQIETTYRALLAGFEVLEVPITFEERDQGESKMSKDIVFEAIWKVWTFRLRRSALRRRLQTARRSLEEQASDWEVSSSEVLPAAAEGSER